MSESSLISEKEEVVTTPNVIVDTAGEIEAMDASAVELKIEEIIDSTNFGDFKLGGLLAKVESDGYWKSYGHASFKAYLQIVEENFGVSYRKQRYLIDIYNKLVNAEIPWEKVSGLGWTKLKELGKVLTAANVDLWVGEAEKLTVLQLQVKVAEAMSADGKAPTLTTDEDMTTAITTFTVKVHEDQKEIIKEALSKARDDTGSDYDGVALEAIAMSYLESGAVATLKTLMAKSSPEEVMDTFEQLWPHFNITVTGATADAEGEADVVISEPIPEEAETSVATSFTEDL